MANPRPTERGMMLFESIHQVMAAEAVFAEQGVWCDLVPVPRDLDSNCGMAVEFCLGDLEAVGKLAGDERIKPRTVYRRSKEEYEEIAFS